MADNVPSGPAGAVPPKPAEAKVQPKKETVRISLPPKPTAAPTIKLPTLPPAAGAAAPAGAPAGAAAPPTVSAPHPGTVPSTKPVALSTSRPGAAPAPPPTVAAPQKPGSPVTTPPGKAPTVAPSPVAPVAPVVQKPGPKVIWVDYVLASTALLANAAALAVMFILKALFDAQQ
ncbi:MAG: hypothetical protein WCO56_04700 [Verrucomicrobiota bacterium]